MHVLYIKQNNTEHYYVNECENTIQNFAATLICELPKKKLTFFQVLHILKFQYFYVFNILYVNLSVSWEFKVVNSF